MKYAFIRQQANRHGIQGLCMALKVSRSGYYHWLNRAPSPSVQTNRLLADKIKTVFSVHKGRYGSPRVHAVLQRDGEAVSQSRVARLMRRQQLVATR